MKKAAWEELLALRCIVRAPTDEEKKRCGRSEQDAMFPHWLRQVEAKVPELLTREALLLLTRWRQEDAAMAEQFNDQRDRENKRGKHAPLIVVDQHWQRAPGTTGSATDRQKEYLRQLGVRDQEPLLNGISKAEASQLIDDVLKLRGEA